MADAPLTPTEKITRDLATIQRIAERPQTENPLLVMLLQQAAALGEIRAWALNAQQLLVGDADPAADGG
jgi:hypothetical protein